MTSQDSVPNPPATAYRTAAIERVVDLLLLAAATADAADRAVTATDIAFEAERTYGEHLADRVLAAHLPQADMSAQVVQVMGAAAGEDLFMLACCIFDLASTVAEARRVPVREVLAALVHAAEDGALP